jgi:hypothetical protein
VVALRPFMTSAESHGDSAQWMIQQEQRRKRRLTYEDKFNLLFFFLLCNKGQEIKKKRINITGVVINITGVVGCIELFQTLVGLRVHR